jgi:hypothetical protein
MKQAVVGIRVSFMLETDPKGILGPKSPRPDVITVSEAKS